jgi:hypothetical protein
LHDDEDEAFRRTAEALRARDEKVVRVTLNGWSKIDTDDLAQFRSQAEREAATYAERERPTLARTFAGLAALAASEFDGRASGDAPAVWLSFTAPLDETSGSEANKDDLGVLVTRALVLFSDAETRNGTRNMWGRLIAEMMGNRDRLRSLGLAL